MTKADLVDRVARAVGLPKHETAAVIDGVLEAVAGAVADGERVELRGFGTFEARRRAARTGRNPRTNEAVPIAPRTVPAFRPAERFRRRVADADPSAE